MDGLVCDGCGNGLLIDEDVRYKVKIEVFAAYDPLEITREDLARAGPDEMSRLISSMEGMDPRELEEEVYVKIELDLCPKCRKRYLKDPLGFRAGGAREGE